jgi:hypothetical protein
MKSQRIKRKSAHKSKYIHKRLRTKDSPIVSIRKRYAKATLNSPLFQSLIVYTDRACDQVFFSSDSSSRYFIILANIASLMSAARSKGIIAGVI